MTLIPTLLGVAACCKTPLLPPPAKGNKKLKPKLYIYIYNTLYYIHFMYTLKTKLKSKCFQCFLLGLDPVLGNLFHQVCCVTSS